MDCFDFDIINRYILNKHYLGAVTAPEDISELIQSIGGLPAATSFTPYLSLFARKPDFKRDQLDKILYDQATIAKIRGPRREMLSRYIVDLDTADRPRHPPVELDSAGYSLAPEQTVVSQSNEDNG